MLYSHPTSPRRSYHIHVLFIQDNADAVTNATQMHDSFVSAFNLTSTPPCPGKPGDPWNAGDDNLCMFAFQMEPSTSRSVWACRRDSWTDPARLSVGPFACGQWSAFVPLRDLEIVTRWAVQHRGVLDVLFHTNSGCGIHDHTTWARWSGTAWPINTGAITCNYPGCVPHSNHSAF